MFVLLVLLCCFFRYYWCGDILQEREKIFFYSSNDEQYLLKLASYCSSIADFQPIGESGAACFAHLLLKFCCFQPNVEVGASALTLIIVFQQYHLYFSHSSYPLPRCIRCFDSIESPFMIKFWARLAEYSLSQWVGAMWPHTLC